MTAIDAICFLKRLGDDDRSRVEDCLRRFKDDMAAPDWRDEQALETLSFHVLDRHTDLLRRLASRTNRKGSLPPGAPGPGMII